jgi:hypothetical protein
MTWKVVMLANIRFVSFSSLAVRPDGSSLDVLSPDASSPADSGAKDGDAEDITSNDAGYAAPISCTSD